MKVDGLGLGRRKDAVEMSIYKSGNMSIRNLPLAALGKGVCGYSLPGAYDFRPCNRLGNKAACSTFLGDSWLLSERIYGRPPGAVREREEIVVGKHGQYKVVVDEPSEKHFVRIEADGYRPEISREFKNNEGSVTCDFTLSKDKGMKRDGADAQRQARCGGRRVALSRDTGQVLQHGHVRQERSVRACRQFCATDESANQRGNCPSIPRIAVFC